MKKLWLRHPFLIILCWIVGVLGTSAWAEGQSPPPPSSGIEKAKVGVQRSPSALVMVYNRPIVTFRTDLFGHSPQDRASATRERILAVIRAGRMGEVGTRAIAEGTLIQIGDQAAFLIAPEDVDPISGDTTDQTVARAVKNLKLALDEAREARRLSALIRAAVYSAVATVLFLGFFWGLVRGFRWLMGRLEAFELRHVHKIRFEGLAVVTPDQIVLVSRFL